MGFSRIPNGYLLREGMIKDVPAWSSWDDARESQQRKTSASTLDTLPVTAPRGFPSPPRTVPFLPDSPCCCLWFFFFWWIFTPFFCLENIHSLLGLEKSSFKSQLSVLPEQFVPLSRSVSRLHWLKGLHPYSLQMLLPPACKSQEGKNSMHLWIPTLSTDI